MKQIALLVILILISSVLVYLGLDSLELFPVKASAQAETIDWLFNIELIAISFLFSLIVVPLVYSLVVYRRKPGEEGEGEDIEGNTTIEIIWTVIPLLIVLGLAYLGAWSLGDALKVDPEARIIEVKAFQWGWTFFYPESGVTSTELYLPIDKQTLLEMESRDVIHSFWVPEFRIKQDIVPGQVTEYRITPIELGDYSLRCAELCGTSHSYMNAPVKVVTQIEFDTWIEEQIALIPDDVGPNAARGEILATNNGCFSCHSIDGSILVGPSWKGVYGSEVELADGTTVLADEAFIQESILEPNAKIVAGFQSGGMPQYTFTAEQIADLIEYIKTLE